MINTRALVRFIEDDEVFRSSQELLLRAHGFEVAGFSSAVEFLEHDDLLRPGCLVLDVRMPGMTGLELQNILLDISVGARRHCHGRSRHAARRRQLS